MSATPEQKKNYIHYVPPARLVPEWHKNFNFVLIRDMEQLKKIFEGLDPTKLVMSFDTETSSLDPEEGFIVGYSFSLDGRTAYYVPVNHFKDRFNLYEESLDFIYKIMCLARAVLLFNTRFDSRFMEYHGFCKNVHDNIRFRFIKYDMSKVNMFDVSVNCWLADTNIKMPSLKFSALHFMGYKMQTYAEVSDGVENFFYIDPEECHTYAGSDALCTYLLRGATKKYGDESGFMAKVDVKFLYPLQHFEQEKIFLDRTHLTNLVNECIDKIEKLEKSIYDEVGYHFNLNSPAQVSDAFSRLGIDTGSRTKTGYMKTGIEELENLPEEVKNQHKALARFIEFKTSFKFMSSYAKVLLKISQEKGYLRCSYKNQVVPTGRLASGKDSKNTFFSEINIQSIPKPHPQFYYVLDLKDRNINIKADNIILGYRFIPVEYKINEQTGKKEMVDGNTLYDNYIGFTEGMNTKQNARNAMLPIPNKEANENEWIWAGIDFSGQELRLAANLSREPVWVNAFTSGEDIHKNTAYALWGKENYDKDKRKMAKGANFCETDSNFVYTERGMLRPSQLSKSDKIINRFEDKQDFKMEIVEDQPCIEVLYSNGIKAKYHKNHKLLVWDGKCIDWVAIKDIDKEQVIQVMGSRYNPNDNSMIDLREFITKSTPNAINIDILDLDFAYISGYYLGNGYIDIKRLGGVRIAIRDELMEKFTLYCDRVGFTYKISQLNGCKEISFGGDPLTIYMDSLCGSVKSKKVPDIALSMSDEWKREFIAGILDADGICDCGGIGLSNTNINIISGIALLCSSLGIRTYLLENESGITENGERRYIDKDGNKLKNCYTLVLNNWNSNLVPVKRKNLFEHQNIIRKKSNFGWIIDKSLCEEAYQKSLKINKYKHNHTYLMDNLKSGRQKGVGFYNIDIFNLYVNTQLCENYNPIKILKKIETVDTIYAIEVPTHEYISSSCISHNSIIYGAEAVSFVGDGKTAERPTGMNLAEAEEFYNNYKKGLPTLFAYQDRLIRQCRQIGTVKTYFGRPRRVKYYFANRQIGFGKRTILNDPIQGAAGDILKIVMCGLFKEILNVDEYRDDVMFKITVHDEINYGIRVNRLNEIARKLEKMMEFSVVEWPVPLTVEVSFGWAWGSQFTFIWDKDIGYCPKLEN